MQVLEPKNPQAEQHKNSEAKILFPFEGKDHANSQWEKESPICFKGVPLWGRTFCLFVVFSLRRCRIKTSQPPSAGQLLGTDWTHTAVNCRGCHFSEENPGPFHQDCPSAMGQVKLLQKGTALLRALRWQMGQVVAQKKSCQTTKTRELAVCIPHDIPESLQTNKKGASGRQSRYLLDQASEIWVRGYSVLRTTSACLSDRNTALWMSGARSFAQLGQVQHKRKPAHQARLSFIYLQNFEGNLAWAGAGAFKSSAKKKPPQTPNPCWPHQFSGMVLEDVDEGLNDIPNSQNIGNCEAGENLGMSTAISSDPRLHVHCSGAQLTCSEDPEL